MLRVSPGVHPFAFIVRAFLVVLGAVFFFCPLSVQAQMKSRLLIFNQIKDLLKGDIWELISQDEVGKYLYIYPEKYVVIGFGTTNRPYRMGEVIVSGTADRTSFLWANPEWPYRVTKLHEAAFPWIQIALCDPKKAIKWPIKKAPDLHGVLIERMLKDRTEMGAFHIEAVTVKVQYSISYHLPKTGLDILARGGDKAYCRVFEDKTRARWILLGIYVNEEKASQNGMLPGQPLLMVGYNRDTRHGGLIRLASIKKASVTFYPIESSQLFQSDLTVSDIRVRESRISVDIRNKGAMSAEHVTVLLDLPGSKRRIEAVLPSLGPFEEETVRFRLKKEPSDDRIIVRVDPQNQILETNERNNLLSTKKNLLGW